VYLQYFQTDLDWSLQTNSDDSLPHQTYFPRPNLLKSVSGACDGSTLEAQGGINTHVTLNVHKATQNILSEKEDGKTTIYNLIFFTNQR
jgi:hypothetical protein